MNKHQFALYLRTASDIRAGSYDLTDHDLIHRITHILRLEPQEELIIFNKQVHAKASISAISKKSISCTIQSITPNKVLTPRIKCLLPLIKKAAFEEACYSLSQLGVASIQPIITQKTHVHWGSAKDYERAQQILIAAAEQSKQFVLPEIEPLLPLEKALIGITNTHNIFFDAEGVQASECIVKNSPSNITELILCFGPEGDLTVHEKQLLREYNFNFCKLTPTILKTEQAVALGVGIVRTFL